MDNSAEENRPGTSLNKKRGHKGEDEIESNSYNQFLKEKPQTQQGSRKGNSQNFEMRGSSSSSQFRPVKMTQSFYNQAQRDLGFNPPGSKHDFSKTLSSFHKGSLLLGGPFQSKDYSKVIPKNIMYDKEVLYDELLKTKSSQNLLVQENHQLKTKLSGMQVKIIENALSTLNINGLKKEEIQRICKKDQANPFEQDSNKYKQVFKESMSSSQNFNRSSSATLVINLKKQITDLQNELQTKNQSLSKIQRSVKLTSIKELEVQLKMYSEECLRLRRMLEQQIKLDRDERFKNVEASEFEGTPRDQNNTYNSAFQLLKQDNIQMAANLKRLEEEIFGQRIVIETLEKQLRNQKHENQQQRRVIQEKDREIDSFKGNDPFVSNGKKNSQFTVEGQLKLEIEKKQSELNLLTHQLQQKDKRIMDAEKKSREKEADLLDKVSQEMKEKQEIQNLLDKEKDVVFKLRQDLERLQQDRRFTKVDIISSQATMNDIENNAGDQSSRQYNARKSMRQNTNVSVRSFQNQDTGSIFNLLKKRLPRVSSEEIQTIGEDLKYKLKLQRVSLNQLEKDEISRNSEISLQEIYNTIQEYPFKISDESQLLALSRYLIEDNSQDWVQFDPNETNSISVVKSVLRHLLDNYTIPSQQQEIKEMVKLTQVLNKQKGGIIDMLQRDPASKKINGQLISDKKQILYVLDQLEIQLTPSEQELMFVKIYEESQNLLQIRVDSIFKIFSQDKFNSTTEISMKDLVDQPPNQLQKNKQVGSQNDLPKKQSETNPPVGKKDSMKNNSGKSQVTNKSKAFKNVPNDFNVYNSNVDQEAVAENQNNYQLDDEEEVESQGQVSNDGEQYQQQSNNRNQQQANNNRSSQINYLNVEQEHEQLQAEQTNYTQQTNSQFQNDPNDLYQDSNDD